MAFVNALPLNQAATVATAPVTARRPPRPRRHRSTPTAVAASMDASSRDAAPDAADGGAEREWRPHAADRPDATEDETDSGEIPVELAEGFLQEGGARPRLDVDADENMLMWKMRRMLHEDDYKRIFKNPRVGEM